MSRRALLYGACAVLLTACGASDSSAPPAPQLEPLSLAEPRSMRALPGLDLQLQAAGPGQAELTVADPGAVHAVAAAAGPDYAAATPVAVQQSAQGRWRLTLPAGRPGDSLLLRFTLTNGDVAETAPGDLRLR